MLVYGKYECFDMQILYVCVLCASCGSSQFCMTCCLLMLVVDERSLECLLLFTPSCCRECFYHLFVMACVLVLRCCECVCCM